MARVIPASFGRWTEEDLVRLPVKEFRFHEAFLCYEFFRLACGRQPLKLINHTPQESQFQWITFADLFLTTLISIEELVSQNTKSALEASDLYRFIKQLRNMTVHHTVLGARRHRNKVKPLVHRIYNMGGPHGNHVDPKLNFARIRGYFTRFQRTHRRHGQHIPGARNFLNAWQGQGKDCVILWELFEAGLEFVGSTCGISLEDPTPCRTRQ